VVKQCIFCGQPLPRDDARFCNGCGRTQISSSNAASGSAIKVKLPPREFSRADSPTPMVDGSRPLAQDQAAQGPSRLPKRPVRLTTQDTASQQETVESDDRFSADVSRASNASRPDESVEENSTMVVSGWQEELAQLRKERGIGSLQEQSQSLAPPVAPTSAQKGPAPLVDLDKTPRRGSAEAIPVKMPPEKTDRPVAPSRRELRVKVWEQEPTAHLPQPPLESSAGPAPAIDQTPFTEVAFGAESEIDQIAAFDTVLWPATARPQDAEVTKKREPVAFDAPGGFISKRADELIEEEEEDGGGVDDLPTVPLAVPEAAKPEPKITIERASTPAPRKWPSTLAEEEDVGNLPTRPIASTFAGPRSPIPAAAPQPSQGPDRFANPNPQPSGARQPGGPAPFVQPNNAAPAGFAPTGPGGRVPNPGSQPGPGFNPSGMPAGPQNPPSQPGNAPQRPAPQGPPPGGPGVPQSRPTTLPPPNTPRPDPKAVEDALKRPRQRKRMARTLVALLVVLLLAGSGVFVWQYNMPSPGNQPYQLYQSTALGFSVSYTQGWNVDTNQAQGVVHFVDSSHTGQVSLSDVAVNNQTLPQHVSQETTQFGMTAPQTAPAVTFAGTSWQQVKGSVVQTGATYTIVLYVTEHGSHFYTLACLAPAVSYTAMEQNDFSHLRSTFQFL
jgi:hypothetical protein